MQYQISCLKSQCEQYMSMHLSTDNAVQVLLLSEIHQADQLKNQCIEFIVDNADKMMSTDSWPELAKRPNLGLELFKRISTKYTVKNDDIFGMKRWS